MTGSERWDAIVVGAGAGGTAAAAYLAAAGQRTLLLEQYDVVGGCSHVFRRKGQWEFDVGIHYLGDCGPGGNLPTLLRGLALEDRVEFLPMDPTGFDTVIRPGLQVRVPVGWDRYLEEACSSPFPRTSAACDACSECCPSWAGQSTAPAPPPRGGAACAWHATREQPCAGRCARSVRCSTPAG